MLNSNSHRIKVNGLVAAALLTVAAAACLIHFVATRPVSAQEVEFERFRDGEKLTYSISFEKFKDAAYAELYVASKGTIEGKQASELRGRIKSRNFVSALFYLFDEARTVFASQETGLPLYVKDTSFSAGMPVDSITSYLSQPATSYDLLTMFYMARENGGAGSFSVVEKGKSYSFDYAPTGGETVITADRAYETNVSTVTSSYFQEYDITEVTVNFSTSADRIPVKIAFRTPKGRFEAILQSVSLTAATPVPAGTETPVPTPTPQPTPTPEPTPIPYVDNESLSPDLPFKLGESLSYRVMKGENVAAMLKFSVDSRKQFNGVDSLLLVASVTDRGDGSLFTTTDKAEVWVDPFTLAPNRFSVSFSGPLAGWSQQSLFNQERGTVTFGAGGNAEVPIGTHSLLSFAYAIRSFNLRPSKDSANPVNDTRVAVFANDRAYILTLRPSTKETIEVQGKKISAQLITIITGEPSVDSLRPRVWLSNDSSRVPLRLVFGSYQAELVR